MLMGKANGIEGDSRTMGSCGEALRDAGDAGRFHDVGQERPSWCSSTFCLRANLKRPAVDKERRQKATCDCR